MAQQRLKFNNYTPPNPDKDGYKAALATTSTSNSGRTMRGHMNNVPLFTVESYNLKWTDISAYDASRILSEVINKSGFSFYHFNIYRNQWETSLFYAANFNAPIISLKEGLEKLSELSFQVTGVDPI